MHKVEQALANVRRMFIGGYRTRSGGRSKYMPHIGAKQEAKYSRLPNGFMDAASRKRAGE